MPWAIARQYSENELSQTLPPRVGLSAAPQTLNSDPAHSQIFLKALPTIHRSSSKATPAPKYFNERSGNRQRRLGRREHHRSCPRNSVRYFKSNMPNHRDLHRFREDRDPSVSGSEWCCFMLVLSRLTASGLCGVHGSPHGRFHHLPAD